MLATTVALLASLTGPMQAGPYGGSDKLLLVADSAHTLVTPNAPDPGRVGQVYSLPGGGFGVSTGGTSAYQTLGMPGGSGIAFSNGSSFIGPAGRVGIARAR
jgi:hypothetical protein